MPKLESRLLAVGKAPAPAPAPPPDREVLFSVNSALGKVLGTSSFKVTWLMVYCVVFLPSSCGTLSIVAITVVCYTLLS